MEFWARVTLRLSFRVFPANKQNLRRTKKQVDMKTNILDNHKDKKADQYKMKVSNPQANSDNKAEAIIAKPKAQKRYN